MERVTRRFKGAVALADLDLTINYGEFVALLGPSGCGKSTTLNCLAGLLPLSGGRIFLDDERVDLLPPERRGFGMVFQNYALFPHLSVRKNIAFGLQMMKVPRAQISQKVEWALDLIHLAAHGDKRPGQLSGGQQQRVAIARAIVMEPRLVLMDEPLSNLDAKLRHEMRAELRRLHRELGLTTIYVTHDQEEALSMADRMVVLKDGVVQQQGSPEAVYANPANQFVADFMGYRNQLEMTVAADADAQVGVVRGYGIELRVATDVRGPAIVAIRPDSFEVGDGPNAISATVLLCEYQGRDYEVEVALGDGTPLHVRLVDRIAIGEKVTLRVSASQIRIFAADSSHTAAARSSARARATA
jgi:putative spermidine/putrescine transport system ATP-binding protein